MAEFGMVLVVSSSSLFIALLLLPFASSSSQLKVTKFRFFLQDKYVGLDRTVYNVAECDITSNSPTYFGQVSVVDDPLTLGPEYDSKLIGYAQGIIAYADLNEPALHVSITFLFTYGDYSGSSFNMVGRNNLLEEHRRIPIVGGTGAFEFAHGIIITSNYSSDPGKNRATFLYDIVITQNQEIAMYLS